MCLPFVVWAAQCSNWETSFKNWEFSYFGQNAANSIAPGWKLLWKLSARSSTAARWGSCHPRPTQLPSGADHGLRSCLLLSVSSSWPACHTDIWVWHLSFHLLFGNFWTEMAWPKLSLHHWLHHLALILVEDRNCVPSKTDLDKETDQSFGCLISHTN